MNCIGYDPIIPPEASAKFNIKGMSCDEIWPQADIITIHVPLLPETENLINSKVIEKCKNGFKLINCARGGIVDEMALLEGLKSGKCSGAALDVFLEVINKKLF